MWELSVGEGAGKARLGRWWHGGQKVGVVGTAPPTFCQAHVRAAVACHAAFVRDGDGGAAR